MYVADNCFIEAIKGKIYNKLVTSFFPINIINKLWFKRLLKTKAFFIKPFISSNSLKCFKWTELNIVIEFYNIKPDPNIKINIGNYTYVSLTNVNDIL